MDIERARYDLRRSPSSAFKRALEGTGRALYKHGTHYTAIPYWASLASAVKRPRNNEVEMPRSRRRTTRSRRSSRRGRSTRRSGVRNSGLTTNQRDTSNRYVARRRSGGSRSARNFRYRVMQTVNADQPLSVYAYSKSVNLNSAVNVKHLYGVGLFTTQMIDQTDLKDLLLDAGIDIAAAAPNPQLSNRVIVKSACLDIQLTNRGAKDALVDIYEVMAVRDIQSTETISSSFQTFFAQTTTITAKDWQSPAVSLFENPVFCRHFKILSKKETQIPPGDLITLQMRYGKDRSISPNTVISYPNSIPKLARFYIFVHQGIPEDNAGTARLSVSNLTISFQKAYKYSVMSGRTTAQIHTV